MSVASTQSKSLGLSILIGIAIGTLAAILSTHFAIWLIAGIFVGIAAGASFGRTKCPDCEAMEREYPALSLRKTEGQGRGTRAS